MKVKPISSGRSRSASYVLTLSLPHLSFLDKTVKEFVKPGDLLEVIFTVTTVTFFRFELCYFTFLFNYNLQRGFCHRDPIRMTST